MSRALALAVLLLIVLHVRAGAQDAKAVVEASAKAMGAAGLDSITYSGGAGIGNFGQSRTISFGLASTRLANYTRTIDFTRPASFAAAVATPPAVRGEPAPQPFIFEHAITPADSTWAEQMQIWVTPWGFLRGAAANGATLRSRRIDGVQYREVTWSPPQKAPSGQPYRVVGYIGPENLVDRVETWVDHPVLGDMHVEMKYTNYQDLGGLMVPSRMSENRVGMETFVAAVSRARANPSDLAQLMAVPPAPGRPPTSAPAPATPAAAEKLAEGVYRIPGEYAALAVEFREYVVVLEAGDSEARGLAIVAETRRLFPNKRLRYVVNTHPHFDHAAGLAAFAAEGATVLTDDPNRYFLEQALRSPRTLVGDALAKSRRRATVEGVVEKMVLSDGTRTIELHHIPRLDHSDGMLLAWLPKERILFTADFELPPSGEPAGPGLVTLAENLERLQIDFDRHVMVHAPSPDRPMTRSELLALVKDRSR